MLRKDHNTATLVLAVLLFGRTCTPAEYYERAGWEAQLSTIYHNVSGTVRILDHNSLEVENFDYDGGGPAVYFYLGTENTQQAFLNGIPAGSLLSGPIYNNEAFTIDLPPGQTMDMYNAISVWCVDFRVNFGSGTFGSVVRYEVTFDASWSSQTHQNFPPNPHFSGLIGGTHSSDRIYWQLGSLASDGIEDMAELGSKSPLNLEFNNDISGGDAYSLISGGGINPSPGSISATFQMHSAFPNITLVSMIAPSPDWFVGVSGLPLFEDGRWLDNVVVELPPYDAGTDSGVDFTSPNADTNPAELITEITGFPFMGNPPLGTFTFRLICDNPLPGDVTGDCRVDLADFAAIASHWLVDCNVTPSHPACQ